MSVHALPITGPRTILITASPDARSRIAAARQAIGPGRADDYVLTPSGHADRHEADAPALAALLRASALEVIARRYEERDAAAGGAQSAFRVATGRARTAVFLTGIAAALVLVAGTVTGTLGEGYGDALMVGGSVMAVVTGGLASLWIRRIRDGHLLEEWMTRRAEAETARLRYFEQVTQRTEDLDPLLQLEYFSRYQLGVQRAYYATRGAQHRSAANRALSRSSGGMAFGGIAGGVAGVLGAALSPAWAALAGVGLAGQAYASAVENGEGTAQDRRNAERYRRTADALDDLHAMLDRVRAAVAAGESSALQEFVESVHEQLSVEHRQWLEEIGESSQAVRRLEATLRTYGEETGGAG